MSNIAFRVPSKVAVPPGSPHRAPIERERCSVSRALHPSLKVLGKMSPSPGSPKWPLWGKLPVCRAFFYIYLGFSIKQGLLIKQNLAFLSKSLVKQHPLQVSQLSTYKERCSVSRASGLFIHSFILTSQSPHLRSCPTKWGEDVSLSMEPHADGRPTYNVVWPDSPGGSFMTLLLLSQCHAAFSTIPSTLAWVD